MAVTFNYALPSATNVFTPPTIDNLIVDFSRNPKDIPLNKLITITPVDKMSGFFPRFSPADAVRMNPDLSNTYWYDGMPVDASAAIKQRHSFINYTLQRRAVQPIMTGYLEKQQAIWDVDAQNSQLLATAMMNQRTKEFYDTVFSTANNLSTHVNTATALGGGTFDNSTSSTLYIKKTFTEVVKRIKLDTNGIVNLNDLTVIVSPGTAERISNSLEIHDYLAQSPAALAQVKGDTPGQNSMWGLPDRLYGVKIFIDDTVANYADRYSAADNQFISDGTALGGTPSLAFIARPGDLVNTGQLASSFSSVHFFMLNGDEMKMEVQDIWWNKLYQSIMWETRQCKLVAPEATFIVTGIFSS